MTFYGLSWGSIFFFNKYLNQLIFQNLYLFQKKCRKSKVCNIISTCWFILQEIICYFFIPQIFCKINHKSIICWSIAYHKIPKSFPYIIWCKSYGNKTRLISLRIWNFMFGHQGQQRSKESFYRCEIGNYTLYTEIFRDYLGLTNDMN